MELFLKLAKSKIIDTEHIILFITVMISGCKETRKARMACKFIKTMISEKLVTLSELKYEVPSFCLSFAKIPEAVELYKLISQ